MVKKDLINTKLYLVDTSFILLQTKLLDLVQLRVYDYFISFINTLNCKKSNNFVCNSIALTLAII